MSNFNCRLCPRKATDAGFCQGHRTEFLISGLPDNFAGRDSFVNQRESASVTRREVLAVKPTPTPSKCFEVVQHVRKPCLRASRKPEKLPKAAKATIPKVKVVRLCNVPTCDKKHFGKTLCKPHYFRWDKLGRPDIAAFLATTEPKINPPDFIIRKGRSICEIARCGKFVASNRMCDMHVYRWRKSGRPDIEEFIKTTPVGRMPPKPRKLCGCGNPSKARGMCIKCYDRERFRIRKLSA